jgi:glucose-1-phosphate adenylyltransferase
MRNILSVILGGGRGSRLFPLTKMRSKPAVPLAGKYRLIDIPISNCLNSGLNQIFILTQFNSESLNRHITRTYRLDAFSQGFTEILAAEQSMENIDWFQGTCDAVRQCLKHFTDTNIEEILILSGDQLYSTDFRKIIAAKQQAKCDIMVACKPMPVSMAHHFGIMKIADDGRIVSFHEKPKDTSFQEQLSLNINGKPHCLASMGIYLFEKNVLVDLLEQNPTMTDFGKELIPAALASCNVKSYKFDGYWEDIGTLKSFYEANLLLTSPIPPLNLFNENWQIFTHARFLPPSKITSSRINFSMIGEGCIIENCDISSSIIGLRSHIGSGTHIESSIIMGADSYSSANEAIGKGPSTPRIGQNCLIKNAIIDKNVCLGDNVRIENKAGVSDYESEHVIIREGITAIEKNAELPDGFQI